MVRYLVEIQVYGVACWDCRASDSVPTMEVAIEWWKKHKKTHGCSRGGPDVKFITGEAHGYD